MLTYEDCLALTRLTDEEVDAIAVHEHLPEIIALELGHYLCETPNGERCLSRMILDDIEAARARGDLVRAARLRLVLAHFVHPHPAAAAA